VTGSDHPDEPAIGPTASFGFNLAKIPDHGEDSDPILRDGPDLGIVVVFDGMGGAGGTVYTTDDGSRSGAYIASRIARDVVEERLLALLAPERPMPGEATATELHDAIETALQQKLQDLKAPASGLRSRLLRALPTTMAVGVLQRREPESAEWICHVLWAGDSRVYAFTPSGMHQLSIDDLRDEGDAMANLQHDSVISNAISADTDFAVNHRRVMLEAPFFIVSATDGCFGYLRSPMHFEEVVLRSLASSATEEEWSTALQAEIAAVTGDDAAMATIAVGADLPMLRELYGPRLAELDADYTAPMDELLDEVTRAEQRLVEAQLRRDSDTAARWRRYKSGYEQYLREGTDSESEIADDVPQRRIWNPAKPIATGVATASGETATPADAPEEAVR